MDPVKRITKNSLYVLAGNMFAALMTFLISAYIARYLGSEVFGRYSFVFAYLSFFMVVSVFGIDAIIVRELSRYPEKRDKLLSAGIVIKIFASALATAVSIALIMLLPYQSSVRLGVAIASSGLIFYSIAMTFSGLFQARLEMIYSSIATIISKIVFIGLTFYVVFHNGGFVQMIVASTVAFFVQAVSLYLFARGKLRITPKIDTELSGFLLKEAWPLALMNIFITVYYRIDVVILSLLKGTEQVGFYSAAYMIIEAPAMLSVAFMISMFPLMSLYYKSSNQLFKEIYIKSFKYVAMLAVPIVVGGFLLRKEIIYLIYGSGYASSVQALGILIFASVFIMINVVGANVITAINKQKVNMTIVGLGMVLNVGLNFFLIPSMGFIGASIVTVMTELFIFLCFTGYIYRETKIIPSEGLLKVLAASLLMGAFLLIAPFSLIPKFIIAAVIYGVLVLLLKVLDNRDIELFKRMLPGLKIAKKDS